MIYIKSKNLKLVLVEFNISGTSHMIQLERGDLDHGIRLAEPGCFPVNTETFLRILSTMPAGLVR